jgi:hypothetical protein
VNYAVHMSGNAAYQVLRQLLFYHLLAFDKILEETGGTER